MLHCGATELAIPANHLWVDVVSIRGTVLSLIHPEGLCQSVKLAHFGRVWNIAKAVIVSCRLVE